MSRLRSALPAFAAATLLAVTVPANAKPAPTTWITSWSTAPQPPVAGNAVFPPSPAFRDQTLVQIVRVSAGGRKLRLRLSNAFGAKPLSIGHVRVGLAGPDGVIIAGSDRELRFSGNPGVQIPAGAPALSDPLDLAIQPGTMLTIRMYLPDDTGPCTCHPTAFQQGWVLPGDQTEARSAPDKAADLPGGRAFIASVETEAGHGRAATIAVLGDSLADGMGSTPGRNSRWPDLLADRLFRSGRGSMGVANQGISGNRLLAPGAGESALARLDRDVLALPGVRYLVVTIGINDIGAAQLGGLTGPMADLFRSLFPASGPVDRDTMIAGYRQIIARAHARGIRVYGATITPEGGAPLYTAAGEALRQAVNAWIRTSGEFDAVLDFDEVWRDPAHPERIRNDYQSGDFLHGNDAGYKALASSIDLKLFD